MTAVGGGLDGYEVAVGVCGGIAAYKVCEVVSSLVQGGAGVQVAMTRAARRLIRPATFQALTARPVHTSLWSRDHVHHQPHIHLTEQADVMLIAPATADILAKAAHGLADDLVSTMIAAAACPVIFAPSMNERMWGNPLVQANVHVLCEHGYQFIDPGSGWLACRTVGAGRLAEPAAIVAAVSERLRASPPRRSGNAIR